MCHCRNNFHSEITSKLQKWLVVWHIFYSAQVDRGSAKGLRRWISVEIQLYRQDRGWTDNKNPQKTVLILQQAHKEPNIPTARAYGLFRLDEYFTRTTLEPNIWVQTLGLLRTQSWFSCCGHCQVHAMKAEGPSESILQTGPPRPFWDDYY